MGKEPETDPKLIVAARAIAVRRAQREGSLATLTQPEDLEDAAAVLKALGLLSESEPKQGE